MTLNDANLLKPNNAFSSLLRISYESDEQVNLETFVIRATVQAK